MDSPQRPTERPPLVCLYCGCSQLASTTEEVGPDCYIICGKCCAVHMLVVDYEWEPEVCHTVPKLRALYAHEKEAARGDAGVKRFRDAFQIVEMENRIQARKSKGKGIRLTDGQQIKLTGYGPDYRGPRS